MANWAGKCKVCGRRVESDYEPHNAYSEHREQVRKMNTKAGERLRAAKTEKQHVREV